MPPVAPPAPDPRDSPEDPMPKESPILVGLEIGTSKICAAIGEENERGEFTLYEPVGCEVCSGTGYKGRLGLHELLLGSDKVKRHIQEHARVAEILATALEEGMRTLKQDGMEKVLQGITDMKQVRAVCIK